MTTIDAAELWENVNKGQKRITLLKNTSLPLPLGEGRSRRFLIQRAAESMAATLVTIHAMARQTW